MTGICPRAPGNVVHAETTLNQWFFGGITLLAVGALTMVAGVREVAAEPPRQLPAGLNATTVIDLLVEARWLDRNVTPMGLCDDRTFARRVYLDLAGRVPTWGELQNFLQESDSSKRAHLVDRLLESEEHARHMAQVHDTVLMGRGEGRRYRQRQENGWLDFLQQAFRENRSWDQVARQILLARPENPDEAGAVWYIHERSDKHQELAEAISAGFFGVQIQCAQCHDHPMAYEIEQAHYWGLVAFFRRGKNVTTPAGPRVAESAVGGFEQFTDLVGISRDNRLVFLESEEVEEPRPDPEAKEKEEDSDDLYRDRENDDEPRVPLFSRREQFVNRVLADNPLVARAFVNRTWALLLGRGLVHPHDQLDSTHPPSHPELLDWLAEDFQRNGYNVRRLIRQIVLSRPYQLAAPSPLSADSVASDAAETSDGGTIQVSTTEENSVGEDVIAETSREKGLIEPADFATALEKPLTAEVYLRSILLVLGDESFLATGEETYGDLLAEFRERFPDVLPEENISHLQQAMFLSNSPTLQQVLLPAPGNLADRLMAEPDHGRRVEQAFETILGRSPGEEEQAAATQFLLERASRPVDAIRDLLWAIVMSAEFRLNHS